MPDNFHTFHNIFHNPGDSVESDKPDSPGHPGSPASPHSSDSHIRPAEDRDIPAIMNLLLQVCMVHHNGRPDLFKGPATKYTESQLRDIIRDPDTPVFVYAGQDPSGNRNILGYAFCIFQQKPHDNIMTDIKTLYIDDLCVDESLRQTGVGQALFQYVQSFAKKSGCYNLTLNVWAANPGAMKFYQKMGLVPQKTGMEMIL